MIAALLAGFATVFLLQPWMIGPDGLSFPYQLCAGTVVAAIVAAIPRGKGLALDRAVA